MKVIFIGGPYNHTILEVKAASPVLKSNINNKAVIYEKTPAIVEGYPAYRFKEINPELYEGIKTRLS